MANPIIAAIASFIIPGLGQIYAGDVKRGIMFLIVAIIFCIIGFSTTGIFQIISVVIETFTGIRTRHFNVGDSRKNHHQVADFQVNTFGR